MFSKNKNTFTPKKYFNKSLTVISDFPEGNVVNVAVRYGDETMLGAVTPAMLEFIYNELRDMIERGQDGSRV